MNQHQDTPEWMKVTEVELVYKNKLRPSARPKITSSQDAADLFRLHWDMEKIELLEIFKIMLLNCGNRVLGISTIAQGGISTCMIDPRLIFSIALKANATQILLCHNHPSGDQQPSKNDRMVTHTVHEVGQMIGIKVTDHIIITTESYYSFADNGLL